MAGKRRLRKPLRIVLKSPSGASIVFSTVIVSSVILMIAIVTASVANNVLELQMQAAEFENAKMGMRLLEELITDVGLRHGSGGSVRFNARAGGFNVNVVERKFTVQWKSSSDNSYQNIPELDFPSLVNLSFRGGSLMSTYDSNLAGSPDLFIEDPSSSLGYLRTEQKNGAWIRLDFNRIRIIRSGTVSMNGQRYFYVGITFIRLIPGSYGGSYPPTLNVKVQNLGIEVASKNTYSNSIKIRILIGGQESSEYEIASGEDIPIVLTVTVAKVSVSLTGGG